MNRQVLKLAVPNIITHLTVPLLGLADTAIMGHLPSPVFLGAIALGSVVFNFIFWGFGFLRMGTTGITAQAYGADDREQLIQTLARGVALAILLGLALILTTGGIAWLGFHFVKGEEEVRLLASSYFRIRVLAAPATLVLMVFYGWFLGMQNALFPMLIAILVNLLNIGFNLFFVFGLGFTSDGVAWGTVCAQYTGLFLGLLLIGSKYRYLLDYFRKKALLQPARLKVYFRVNRDLFIRTLALLFVFYFFTVQSANLGEAVLAGNAVLQQLISLVSYAVDGFAIAAESLVGRYTGEANMQNLKKAIRVVFRWGMSFGVVFTLLFLAGGRELIRLLTDQPETRAFAIRYLPWVIVLPVVNAASYLWDGVYIGLTATALMRNIMIGVVAVLYVPVFYLLRDDWGANGLWLAFTLFMLFRGVFMTWYARRAVRRAISL